MNIFFYKCKLFSHLVNSSFVFPFQVEEMEEEQQEYEKFLERAFQEQKEEDYEPEEPEQELFQRIMRAEDEYPYDSQDLEMLREYYENL